MVLNPKTGKIAPQWNVMFDDWFSTVTIEEKNLPDFHSDEWSKMFGICAHAIPNEDEDAEDCNVQIYDGDQGQLMKINRLA